MRSEWHINAFIDSFACYMGSAIYTASIPGIMEHFHVESVVATLGLSLYVLGYGIAPMVASLCPLLLRSNTHSTFLFVKFLSPLQELPILGRNPVYIITLTLFAILQIPTALSTNVAGLLVLRFITGLFASPALATGGASVSDM